MKCPNCKTEMEKGKLGVDNEAWLSDQSIGGALDALSKSPPFGNPKLIAYRCPKCGKIELTSEVKE